MTPIQRPEDTSPWPSFEERATSMRLDGLRNELYRLSRARDRAEEKVVRHKALIRELETLQELRRAQRIERLREAAR